MVKRKNLLVRLVFWMVFLFGLIACRPSLATHAAVQQELGEQAEVDVEANENQAAKEKVAERGDDDSDDSKKSSSASEQQAITAAIKESALAPQQRFFNHWLWLVLFSFSMFVISYVPRKPAALLDGAEEAGSGLFDKLQRFAFRFTAIYLCLFFFPIPFAYIPYIGMWIYPTYMSAESSIVAWVAESILGISSDFAPRSGSGDSTRAYVRLFSVFCISLILSLVWTVVDRRKTDYGILKDLFHSNIALVLALTMLNYGLAKVGYSRNQFAIISGSMLETTWGDTSPMGALWRFMGTSRPYTIFAGLGETVGAILLVFRRTRTLGALVIFGVMLNVVMLNFCYDVPVKINSTHLAVLALCLAMRDWGRMQNILFFNRATEPVHQNPPYTGPRTIWGQRLLKAAVVIMWFCMPIYAHVVAEIEHANRPAEPEYFQSFSVKEFRVDGEVRDPEDSDTWERVAIARKPMSVDMKPIETNWFSVKTHGKDVKAHSFEIEGDKTLVMGPSRGSGVEVPEEIELSKNDSGDWELAGVVPAGQLSVVLNSVDDLSTTLRGRGFRWVNEVPFNR